MKKQTIQRMTFAAAFVLLLSLYPAGAQEVSVDEKLVLGKAALEDGLYSLAEKYFTQYVEETPTKSLKGEGSLWLAQALHGQGRYKEMLDLLERRDRWTRRHAVVAGYTFWKAMAQAELGRYKEALGILKKIPDDITDDSYARQGLRLRAKCYVKLGDMKRARKAFAEFQEEYPGGIEGAKNYLDWAGVLIELDQREESVVILEQLSRKYPKSEPAHLGMLWLADIWFERGVLDKSRDVLLELTQQEDVQADVAARAWFALARIYEGQTNLTEAVKAVEAAEASAATPTLNDQAQISRGRLLIRVGRTEDGVKLLHEWVGRNSEESLAREVQLELAQTLLDNGLHELALQEFQNFLDAFADPHLKSKALLGRGWALFELGRYAEAAAGFDKVYGLSTDRDEKKQALLKAADSLFANGQLNLAREKYLAMTKAFPGTGEAPQALFQASECLARLGQIEQAEKDFQAIEDAYSDSPFAERSALSIALLEEEQGLWDKALGRYNRFMMEYPAGAFFAQALYGRGVVRYRVGRFEEALEDFVRVVEDHPQSDRAEQSSYMRGWTLYLMGQNEEALAVCRDFVESHPSSPWTPDVLFWLAEYHYNHGEFADAEKRSAMLAKQFPKSQLADEALYWAGRAAAAQREYLRAIEHFNGLTKNYSASPKLPEARFQQGDALSELGQFAGAILAFEEVIKKFPNSYLADLARGRKGDCQFTLGSDDPMRYEEALTSYKTILDGAHTLGDLKLQAEYKIARCKEKMDRQDEAFEHYMNVVYGYLASRGHEENGGGVWFTRSAFSAAAIKEAAAEWREALNIYRRVIEAGVPAAEDANERITKIRLEHWFL